MDENLARLNRIYPNSKYVLIPKYNPEQWVDKSYDSSLDNKAALNRWKSKPLTYDEAVEKAEKSDRPCAIIAHTTKGKGCSFMENQAGWHGKAPNDEQLECAIKEFEGEA